MELLYYRSAQSSRSLFKVRHELVQLLAIRNEQMQQDVRLLSIHHLPRGMPRLIAEGADYGQDARKMRIEILPNLRR